MILGEPRAAERLRQRLRHRRRAGHEEGLSSSPSTSSPIRTTFPRFGASLARYATCLITRLAGLAYPPFVVFVIVATGNHFPVEAAADAAIAGVALVAAPLLVTPPPIA